MKVKVASEWLNACSGCEISIVDLGERLLDVLELVDFVHIPALLDHKYYGQLGEQRELSIPEAEIGIISGSIRNHEHLEVAREMRKKCRLIIALGTCATHGGIPALANSCTTDELMEYYYSTQTTDRPEQFPANGLPALLDSCQALDEQIRVDIYLPGCPPHPDQIFHALTSLLGDKGLALPEKSVCDTCPCKREGKGQVKRLQRFLHDPVKPLPGESLDKMRCFLEQGYLCMGPVTRAGCGGDNITPRCIAAQVPCRGCSGPVKHDGNQLLDMLSALAANGTDIRSLPEYTSLLRFSGGHGQLYPKKDGCSCSSQPSAENRN